MKRIFGFLLVLLLLAVEVKAQTSPPCNALPNLACASGTPTTQTVNTQHLFSGANVGAVPMKFDGTTAGTFNTSLTVTNPTANRTATIPDADSAMAVATGLPCGANNHISNFSASTGAFTCSADAASSTAWDGITNPTGALTITAPLASVSTFIWNSAVTSTGDFFTFKDITANTGTGHLLNIQTVGTSAMKPFVATAKGTANGVEMSNAGLLAKIGTGSVQADNIVFGSDAQGDIALRGASVYARLAIGANNTVLHSNGTTALWAAIASGDIGPGDLANALVWAESKTSCSPNCALANSPRVSTGATPTVLLVSNSLVMKPVASCGGVNEFTISGATVTPCDTTNNATFQAYYEL